MEGALLFGAEVGILAGSVLMMTDYFMNMIGTSSSDLVNIHLYSQIWPYLAAGFGVITAISGALVTALRGMWAVEEVKDGLQELAVQLRPLLQGQSGTAAQSKPAATSSDINQSH